MLGSALLSSLTRPTPESVYCNKLLTNGATGFEIDTATSSLSMCLHCRAACHHSDLRCWSRNNLFDVGRSTFSDLARVHWHVLQIAGAEAGQNAARKESETNHRFVAHAEWYAAVCHWPVMYPLISSPTAVAVPACFPCLYIPGKPESCALLGMSRAGQMLL